MLGFGRVVKVTLELHRRNQAGGDVPLISTKHAHSQRAFLSGVLPGEASAVKVETRGKRGVLP